MADMVKKYLDKFPVEGKEILDVSAGNGVYSFTLAAKGGKVTAMDYAGKHISQLQKRQEEEPILKAIQKGTVESLKKYREESFDTVLCLGAYDHLMNEQERKESVAECLRVLKKGGIIYMGYLKDSWNEESSISDLYTVSPEELESEMVRADVAKVAHPSVEEITYIGDENHYGLFIGEKK